MINLKMVSLFITHLKSHPLRPGHDWVYILWGTWGEKWSLEDTEITYLCVEIYVWGIIFQSARAQQSLKKKLSPNA